MKKFFLWAVVISALCSSCETADEYIAQDTKDAGYMILQSDNSTQETYNLYQNILHSFEYDRNQSGTEYLLAFENHVNLRMEQYAGAEHIYAVIDMEQLTRLQHAPETVLEALSYKPEVTQAIQELLKKHTADISAYNRLEEEDKKLMQTLWLLHNDHNDDDNNDDKRIVAFAYGAQYSLTQAILYAGAIELQKR